MTRKTTNRVLQVALASSVLFLSLLTDSPDASATTCPTVGPTGVVTPAPANNVNWAGCNLTSANINNVSMIGANLSGANLTAATVFATDLTNANLTNATLTSALLANTTVTGTTFAGASMAGIRAGSLTGSPASLPANWKLVTDGGSSDGVLVGPGVDITGGLMLYDLTGANLTGAKLNGGTFVSVNFTSANLTNADVHGANLDSSNLTSANLTNSNLSGATLPSVTFVSAILGGANFTNAVFQDSDLTGATGFASAVLTGATWSNTTCPDGTNSTTHTNSCAFSLDTSAPTATPAVTAGTLGKGGWYTSHPTVTWNWADTGGSGTNGAACTATTTAVADGDPVTLSATCSDKAGNVGHASLDVKVDTAGPTASATQSPAQNAAGWNGGPVTVTWNWSDLGSSVDSVACPPTSTTSGEEGNPVAVAGTCQDKAGNVGHATYNVKVDTTPPTAFMVRPSGAFSLTQSILAAWSGNGTGSGIAAYTLRVARAPEGGGVLSAWATPTTWQSMTVTSTTMSGTPGYNYCLEVRSVDRAGNASPWSSIRCNAVPFDDRSLGASKGWTRSKGKGWLASTFTSASKVGVTLTKKSIVTRQIGVIATTCTTCGAITVYVGKTKIGTLNLHARRTTTRQLVLLPRLKKSLSGTLRLVVVSRGKLVRIDGLANSAS